MTQRKDIKHNVPHDREVAQKAFMAAPLKAPESKETSQDSSNPQGTNDQGSKKND